MIQGSNSFLGYFLFSGTEKEGINPLIVEAAKQDSELSQLTLLAGHSKKAVYSLDTESLDHLEQNERMHREIHEEFMGNYFNALFGTEGDGSSDVEQNRIRVPAHGSTVHAAFDGAIMNEEYLQEYASIPEETDSPNLYLTHMLSKLNNLPDPESHSSMNYRELVAARIANKIAGDYSMLLSFLGSKSSFIFAAAGKPIHFYFLRYGKCNMLVWTNRLSLIHKLEELINETEFKPYHYLAHLTSLDNQLLVLQPLYVNYKYWKWRTNLKHKGGMLLVLTAIKNYLNSYVVPIEKDIRAQGYVMETDGPSEATVTIPGTPHKIEVHGAMNIEGSVTGRVRSDVENESNGPKSLESEDYETGEESE